MKITPYVLPVLTFVFSIFAGYIIFTQTHLADDKHFSLQALAFIKGDLFLSPINLPGGDIADYFARQYIFYGPMPAVILVPAVFIFGKNFPQITLSIVSLFVTYIAVFLLSKKFTKSLVNSFWLANFFVFGTVLFFHSLVNISAFVVQALAVMFLVLALSEYFAKKRWFVIGILVAGAGLTRVTLYPALVFFLLEIFRNCPKPGRKQALFFLLVPVILSLILWGTYNRRRFGSIFETGYRYNISLKTYPIRENSRYGLFNIKYLPTNLYLFLLRPPNPIFEDYGGFILRFPYLKTDGWGMAIWFTSPLFLYLFKLKKETWTISALIAVVILAIPSLFYFGLGFIQFGYRYSLDFLPFLFLLILPSFRRNLPFLAKMLIFFGIFFSFFIILTSYVISF